MIIEKMKESYGVNVLFAAKRLAENDTDRICTTYQKAWDNGESFTGTWGTFSVQARIADSEEELTACIKQLHNDLCNLVRREWVSHLTREQASDICNVLLLATITDMATLTICEGISYTAGDICSEWNKLHAEEKPLFTSVDDIG